MSSFKNWKPNLIINCYFLWMVFFCNEYWNKGKCIVNCTLVTYQIMPICLCSTYCCVLHVFIGNNFCWYFMTSLHVNLSGHKPRQFYTMFICGKLLTYILTVFEYFVTWFHVKKLSVIKLSYVNAIITWNVYVICLENYTTGNRNPSFG